MSIEAQIRETGDRWVYEVRSRTRRDRWYRCDLTAHAGAGQCACKGWQTVRWPAIRDGAEPCSPATECWHMAQLHRRFLGRFLARLAEEESDPSSIPYPAHPISRLTAP